MEKQKITVAENDKLMKEWNHEKNAGLNPNELTLDFQGRAWWKCPDCGHEWMAQINHRASGHGCPYCQTLHQRDVSLPSTIEEESAEDNGLKNSLSKVYPDVAAQWHPIKNGEITPDMVSATSRSKVWWVCPDCGFEWQATVGYRSKNSNCPNCNKNSR